MEKQKRHKENKSFKDYIHLLKNNLILITIITLVSVAIAIIYALNANNIFKSTTTLKISKPSGSILKSPLLPEFQDFGSDRLISNEIEILKSYNVREMVAQALIDSFKIKKNSEKFYLVYNQDSDSIKAGKYLKSIPSVANLLEKIVTIDQKRGLDIADISVESASAYEAALIANCYADSYKKLNLSINRNQLTIVKNFLLEQRLDKQKELSAAEEVLRGYQEKGGIIALDIQAKNLIEQLADFDAKKSAAMIDMNTSTKVLSELKSLLQKQDPRLADYLKSFADEAYVKTLQEQLGRLEVNKDLALANDDVKIDKTKILKEYDNKIVELKKKLNAKIAEIKNAIFASSPDEVKELSQQIFEEEIKNQAARNSFYELGKIVTQYETKFNKLPKTTIELARFQRKREALEKLYLLVEEKYHEALINEQSQAGNVLIIDKGRVAEKPAKPNRVLIIIIGLLIGNFLAIGVVFIRDYLDTTVKTPEDLQERNINVLAWIPKIDEITTIGKNFEFIVAKRPESIPSEAFRALRTRVQYALITKKNLRTIHITSSTPQEGKTTIAVNLAGTFAQNNKKTVIIDCDLRKPRVHTVFNEKRFPGIVDYFFGEAKFEEIVRQTSLENLFFITAGTIPPNPSEMLGSKMMIDFIEQLKSQFDIIIVDSPPIIAVTDSEIISKIVDATILVVSSETTEFELMEKSVELLKGENFIGTVLNNFSFKSGYGSYYKYYYYYSHVEKSKDLTRKV